MGIKLENTSLNTLDSFSSIMKPLVSYVKRKWNCKDFKPKGYNDVGDDDVIHDDDIKNLEKNFKGILDERACSFTFPVQLDKRSIKYQEEGQGHEPIDSFISACVSYGMVIEQHRQKEKLRIKKRKHNDDVKLTMRACKWDLKDQLNLNPEQEKMVDELFKTKYFQLSEFF